MDVPEAWLVEPVRSAYDLDNLRLADLGQESTLHAGGVPTDTRQVSCSI